MGGGRRHWLPLTDYDREERNQRGRRTDGRNLLDDWVHDKKTRDLNAEYVWNKAQFDKVDPRHTDYLLGKASTEGGEGGNGILITLYHVSCCVLARVLLMLFLNCETGCS